MDGQYARVTGGRYEVLNGIDSNHTCPLSLSYQSSNPENPGSDIKVQSTVTQRPRLELSSGSNPLPIFASTPFGN